MAGTRKQGSLDKAIKAGEARDYQKAVDILTALLAETDAAPEAFLYLGRSYHALGEFGKAIGALRLYVRSGGDRAAGFFFLGRSFLAAGRGEEAISCLRRSLEAEPDRAPAWALLGAALLKDRRSKAAVSSLERAVSLAPDDRRIFHGYLNALFVRATRLLARGDADMARQMLGFVIENGVDGAGPRLWSARALRELGRYPEALADCEAAIGFSPDDASLRWLRAGLLLAAGQRSEALTEFEVLRRTHPELPGIPEDERAMGRIRASIAFHEESWSESLAESLALLRKDPKDPAIRAIAAESLRALGQFERARDHYERAIEADPNAPYFRLGLALVLWELDDYTGARAAVERAKRLGADPAEAEYYAALCDARLGAEPLGLTKRLQTLIRGHGADPRLMFALGESLYRSGRPDLASGWFEKVLSLVPDHELSLLYRISSAESLKDKSQLAPAYEAYLSAYPDNEKIRREYVNLLAAGNRWKDVSRVLEAGLAFESGGEKSRRLLALAYRNTGRYREAAILYRDLLRADPLNSELLLTLAYCLDRDGKGDYALALLEKAPAAAKKGAAPWIVLGLFYSQRGRTEAAIDALRKAIEIEPGNQRAHLDLGRIYEKQGLLAFAERIREQAAKLGPRAPVPQRMPDTDRKKPAATRGKTPAVRKKTTAPRTKPEAEIAPDENAIPLPQRPLAADKGKAQSRPRTKKA